MDSSVIHEGLWINWSRGRILGATLTLHPPHDIVFGTFLATFIGVATIQLWRLVCILAYERIAPTDGRNSSLNQNHVVLRNAADPATAGWAFFKTRRHWRQHGAKACLYSFLPVILCFMSMLGIFVLGIFGPLAIVAYTGPERLLASSSNCGLIGFSDRLARWDETMRTEARDSLSYLENCHGQDSNTSVALCKTYQQPSIGVTTRQGVPCPFEDRICSLGRAGGFEMSTDFLDSDLDLGINAPHDKRIKYRAIATCSPLQTNESYVRNSSYQSFLGGKQLQYLYGYLKPCSEEVCFIEVYDPIKSMYEIGKDYFMDAQESFAGFPEKSHFIPIRELERRYADTQVFVLEHNSMAFQYKNDDPLFGAQGLYFEDPPGTQWYKSNKFVSIAACATQHQICDADLKGCTQPVGIWQLQELIENHKDLSEWQKATSYRLLIPLLYLPNMVKSVWGLSAEVLDVYRRVITSPSYRQVGHIPSNQWQTEFSHLFSLAVVQLQRSVYSYASNRSPQSLDKYEEISPKLSRSIYTQMCGQQKTKSPHSTVSFSVLGFTLTLVFGVMFILAGLFTDRLLDAARQRWCKDTSSARARSDRWKQDGVLELHQRLHKTSLIEDNT